MGEGVGGWEGKRGWGGGDERGEGLLH